MVGNAHRMLAAQAGGSNDFATLLCIYQKCSQRYGTILVEVTSEYPCMVLVHGLFSANPKKWCSEHFIQWRALKMASMVEEQLSGILARLRVCCVSCSHVSGIIHSKDCSAGKTY